MVEYPLVMPFHSIIWKLAEETLFFMDWDGFCAQALPGETPGSFLRTCASGLSVLGLQDLCPGFSCGGLVLLLLVAGACFFWRQVAFPRLRGTFWGVLALAPALATVAPLAHADTHLWTLPDVAFPYTNLLGFFVLLGLFAAGRRGMSRGPLRLTIAVGVCGALFAPLGLYAPLAGLLLILGNIRSRQGLKMAPLLLALLVLEMGATLLFVYDDLSWGYGVGMSQSILNGAWLEKFGFWPPVAFASTLLAAVVSAGSPRIRSWKRTLPCGCAVCVALGVCVAWGRPISLTPQLEMQRALRAGDFEAVLKVADARDIPPRMETAYRILALCRTRRAANELFRWPMAVRPEATQADELKMDGFDLLYNYGFLLPARLAILEAAASGGSRPVHFRILGDIAFLRSETALAERAWRQLARCPFHRDEAKARLAAWASGTGLAHPALAPLRPIAEYAATWEEAVARRSEPPFFKGSEQNVEKFVYGRMLTVRSAPPPWVCESIFAAYLLTCDTQAVAKSRSMMDVLHPQGVYPKTWQQALLAYVAALPESQRDAFIATLRPGVFSEDEVSKFDAFAAQIKNGSEFGKLRAEFGETYWFYEVVSR